MLKGLCHTCKCVLNSDNCGSSRFLLFGESAYCRPCNKVRLTKYQKENKEKIKENHKKYLQKDPNKWREYSRLRGLKAYQALSEEQRTALYRKRETADNPSGDPKFWTDRGRKYKYGISPEQFAANLKDQDYKCSVCKTVLSFDHEQKKFRPHQDHDHKTGRNRDILCNGCNVMLGNAQDNIEILLSAIRYLEKYADNSSIKIGSVINGAE